MGNFGSFEALCQNAPLPVCNLFLITPICELKGVGAENHRVGDLGTVVIDIMAVFLSILAIIFASRKKAAIGRREIQVILGVYLLISVCDIFTTGRVFINRIDIEMSTFDKALLGFTSVQLGLIVSFFWMLFLFGIVGFQIMDDGTPVSLFMIGGSAALFFAATVYISLDTGLNLSGHFEDDLYSNRSIPLYVFYLVLPLACVVGYTITQLIIVAKILGRRKPLLYLFGAVLFFSGGQILEFYASPFICSGTSHAVDGGFFQTIMSLIAITWVIVLWDSITEDDWVMPDFPSSNSNPSLSQFTQQKRDNTSEKQKGRYQDIYIEKPIGMSVEDGVTALNRYKTEFLNEVETEVWKFIKNSQKRDVMAIVSGGRVYRGPPSHTDGWTRRVWAMWRHKDNISSNLPVYDGEELDSWLTGQIMGKVEDLQKKFFATHSDITGKVMLQRLRETPTAHKAIARQFVDSIRESGEPLTEEMCKHLIHLVSEQMSNHSTDQLGHQLGHALLHVGGLSAISTFATALAHTVGSTVGKLAVKLAMKISLKTALKTGGKIIGKLVISAFITTLSTAAAAKGMGATAAILSHLAMPIIIAAIIAWELSEFTENLADKIAPEVRQIMAGEFENQNRSALQMIGKDTLEDFGIQLAKTLALESGLVESAKEAAVEMAKAKLRL